MYRTWRSLNSEKTADKISNIRWFPLFERGGIKLIFFSLVISIWSKLAVLHTLFDLFNCLAVFYYGSSVVKVFTENVYRGLEIKMNKHNLKIQRSVQELCFQLLRSHCRWKIFVVKTYAKIKGIKAQLEGVNAPMILENWIALPLLFGRHQKGSMVLFLLFAQVK